MEMTVDTRQTEVLAGIPELTPEMVDNTINELSAYLDEQASAEVRETLRTTPQRKRAVADDSGVYHT